MNIKAISIYIGHILKIEGLLMLPAVAVAAIYGEAVALKSFLITAVLAFVIGVFMAEIKLERPNIYAREGFVTVALAWIAISFFGCLPFYISGAIPKFVDCWFETVSGFTTTGSTILTNVEAMPKSMLYWRSFTHWLGGMGVLVFMLAVIPRSSGSGETLHLLRAESPGPTVGKLTPTMRKTTQTLYAIYMALTVMLMILLLLGGMSLFDAVNHALATAGTGGFSTMNASIAAYPSPYIQAVIGIFMVLFGVNFNIYYLLLMGKVGAALANEEFKAYFAIIAAYVAIITANIMPLYDNFGKALLDSFFQVSTVITTTGFATADFNLWPQLSRYMLVVLMIIGASAGSTGGGIKVSRLLILAKASKSELMRLAHPRSINAPRMDGVRIDKTVIAGTHTYMTMYAFICIISMGILAAIDNFSLETTITSVIACMGNIGPGLDMVGPVGNFSEFSVLSKLVLSFDMLAGRLEIFPMMMLFSFDNWKRSGKKYLRK